MALLCRLALAGLGSGAAAAAEPLRLPEETCPSFYSGRIEPHLDVHMFLTRDGSTLTGVYRFGDDEIRVQGSIDAGTGAFTLTEYLPSREGGDSSAGRFQGRVEANGGIRGVWQNKAGRIQRNFSLQAGGVVVVGGNPGYRLLLEPVDGGTEGNYRGWLEWGREAFDLGQGCVHQSSSAMAGPEFENLQVETLPGQPELVHTAMGMTPVVGRETWLHKLYGPGSPRPMLQLEGGREMSGDGGASTEYGFLYRGTELLVTRLDDQFGATGEGAAGPSGRLAPACTETRGERVYRLQLAQAEEGFMLIPVVGFSDADGLSAVSTLFSPACEDDPMPAEDLGPAVVIRNDQGLVSLQIDPDPETGSAEAICWLGGQPRSGRPYFAVPPAGSVKPGFTPALPLTVRWPPAGQSRAVAVFLDPGEAGGEPGNGDLLAFYDRTARACQHRLLNDAGAWGGPIDEGLFRQRFRAPGP